MRDAVKEYYGQTLESSADLKTNACCTEVTLSEEIRRGLTQIHQEVSSRYYGCGIVIPPLLEGRRILDLGSGAGRDCFLLSRLVGQQGSVVGVDMTEEQLAVANNYIDYHTSLYHYAKPNVEFRLGYIERLDQLEIPDNSFDLIISNCVINLSPDKASVLKEAYRVLKPGGELYFSDVYADRRIPSHLVADPVLYGECLSGALYWNDFLCLAREAGFLDCRLVEDRPLTIENGQIADLLGAIRLFSATYRLFKVEGLDPSREDYGQTVTYRGGIPEQASTFILDKENHFERGVEQAVCGNTHQILSHSRFAPYFDFSGEREGHTGLFGDAEEALPFTTTPVVQSKGCCC